MLKFLWSISLQFNTIIIIKLNVKTKKKSVIENLSKFDRLVVKTIGLILRYLRVIFLCQSF